MVFGQSRTNKKILLLLSTLLLLVCYKNIDDIKKLHQHILSQTNVFQLQSSLYNRDKRTILNAKLKFISDWKYFAQARLSSSRVVGGCDMKWEKNKAIPWTKKLERTDYENSFILIWDIRPAGEFSRIVLQTQYLNKTIKHSGGDYWRVAVRGVSSVPVIKTDLKNGSYEFMFLPMVSGQYNVLIVLEYTLCDGIKEPPSDWFVRGNIQGKEQKQGILFHDMPYINKALWSNSNTYFHVPNARIPLHELESLLEGCCMAEQHKCKHLWSGYGSWLNETHWQSLCKDKIYHRYPRKKKGILWIFGDSVASQFYHNIKKNKICKQIFTNCMYTYNWIYSLENYNSTLKRYIRRNTTIEKQLWDENDFNSTKLIEELKEVIYHPSMRDENSVLLLNYGLHFTEATNFSNYQRLISEIIKLEKKIKCKLIWRTTTSLNRYKYSTPNLHSRRFMTSQRVQLYNSYASNAFCQAGFDILDIYPLTDSYPLGSGNKKSPFDPVHYEYHVMKPMEEVLENVFRLID